MFCIKNSIVKVENTGFFGYSFFINLFRQKQLIKINNKNNEISKMASRIQIVTF